MTRTYIDIATGESISINVAGNTYLGKITLGLWDKIGFAPETEEDCKIVARIIRNHVKYQEYIKGYIPMLITIPILTNREIQFFEDVASFFERAKGIRED